MSLCRSQLPLTKLRHRIKVVASNFSIPDNCSDLLLLPDTTDVSLDGVTLTTRSCHILAFDFHNSNQELSDPPPSLTTAAVMLHVDSNKNEETNNSKKST